jgi:DNA-binding NarL/FixJ family response regulator
VVRTSGAITQAGRVLLAEQDGPTRAGLRLALARAGFEVVAEASERASAIRAAVEERPDAVLVSSDLPGGALDVARAIAEELPAAKVIVLSQVHDGNELLAFVLAGAAGYLSKAISGERLPEVLRGVLRGEVALPREHTQRLLDDLRGREIARRRLTTYANATLTDREWQILRLLSDRDSTGQIAHRLRISEVTVRRHVSSVLGKLGVLDRAGAVAVLRHSAR